MKKIAFCALSLMLASAEVKASDVVTSIKPVHSLVSSVMEGIDTPELVVKGYASPHDYSLKPSDAKMISSAKVVFWVGHTLESFLEKPIETLGAKAKVVSLINTPGLVLHEGHDHDHHEEHDDHKDHDDHRHDDHKHEEHASHEKHDDHDDHKHEEHASHEKHDDHAGHDESKDMHIWLDPQNAKQMAKEIARVLSAHDPKNADRYKENVAKLSQRLDDLQVSTAAQLEAVHENPFIVFHDGYAYFEERFHLNKAGAINLNPALKPSAKKISEIRHMIEDKNVTCVFSEPQFNPKMVDLVREGTKAKTAELDILGSGFKDGPELYFTLIEKMTAAFKSCLSS